MFYSHQTCLASLILSITLLGVGATPLGTDPRYGRDSASSFSARGLSKLFSSKNQKTSTGTEAGLKLIGFSSGYTEAEATEINGGTLTTIPAQPALKKQFGNAVGGYLSESLSNFPDPISEDSWECTFAANADKMEEAPKVDIPPLDQENPHALAQFVYSIKNPAGKNAGLTIAKAILLGTSGGDKMMRIPPLFLAPSGSNSLGIKAYCVQKGCTGSAPSASWDWKNIHDGTTKTTKQKRTTEGDKGKGKVEEDKGKGKVEEDKGKGKAEEPICDKSPQKPEWVTKLFAEHSHSS